MHVRIKRADGTTEIAEAVEVSITTESWAIGLAIGVSEALRADEPTLLLYSVNGLAIEPVATNTIRLHRGKP